MMTKPAAPTRKNNWVNLTFFTVTTLAGVVGAPLYVHYYGISAAEVALLLFYFAATGLSITVGYHRLFAHATFKTNRVVRFFLLFFGAAAFEQSALQWSAQHRDHHRYVDTDLDPYSIRKGFFYAHIGWLIFWKHETNYGNVKRLLNDPLVMHQHRYYYWWAFGAGIITPALVGAITGHFLGAVLIAIGLRLTLVYHTTFIVNSVCHSFGTATYDVDSSARDNWFTAFFNFGEGYHNFHHRFAADYRNGTRWYQFDPGKWLIATLEKLGLAWDLKRVSSFRILAARLAGEETRVTRWLSEYNGFSSEFGENVLTQVRTRYDSLRKQLLEWETAAQDYRQLLKAQVTTYSDELGDAARQRVAEARAKFNESRVGWKALLRECATA
jgi:stearoyl-CoA desaturase (delta-9 desaturase)